MTTLTDTDVNRLCEAHKELSEKYANLASYAMKLEEIAANNNIDIRAVNAAFFAAYHQGGHPDFHHILNEMRALHVKKAADYGLGKDVLANCRHSEEFGIPAWVGVCMRINDKVTRLKAFAQNGKLENESVEDSLLDIACYSIIALILLRESKGVKS